MRDSFSFLSEKKYLETQALSFGKKWGLWIWHITSPKLGSRAADPRSTLAEICWKGKFDVRVFNHLAILVSLLNNSSHILPFNSSYMFCAGMQETTTQQQQQQQQTLLNLLTQDRSTPALWETKPLVHSAGSHDLRLQVIRKGAGTTSGECKCKTHIHYIE